MTLRRREYLVEVKKTLSGSKVIAYHGGGDIGSNRFSLGFIGSGENYIEPPFGPGIYFATKKYIAEMYCKYVTPSYIYKVEIPTSNLYNTSWGTPKKLRDKVFELFEKENVKSFKQLSRMLGKIQASKALIGIGVKGAWGNLEAGGEEIAVFDPSIIKIVYKKEVVK